VATTEEELFKLRHASAMTYVGDGHLEGSVRDMFDLRTWSIDGSQWCVWLLCGLMGGVGRHLSGVMIV
jgi:hypothetical protein